MDYSLSHFLQNEWRLSSRLNPYSNGLLSEKNYENKFNLLPVLILILMDYSLGHLHSTMAMMYGRLNPYSNGLLSGTPSEPETPTTDVS